MTNSAFDATASSPVSEIEQRRLAGVGVADQRDRRHRRLVPPLAQLRAAAADRVDLLRQDADAVADAAAVGFELGFAGAARADAAAQPRQRVARSDQPRHQVLELRELDLQLAFPRARAAREDVEDELRAIDDLAIERAFEIAQLRRRQLVVEDDDVDAASRRTRRRAIATLPLPRNVAGSGFGALLLHAQHDVGAGGRGEAGQLVERMFGIEVTRRVVEETDERGAFPRHSRRSLATRVPRRPRPARIERATRTATDASTIVDGAPPRDGPPSRIASTSGSAAATPSASTPRSRRIGSRWSR